MPVRKGAVAPNAWGWRSWLIPHLVYLRLDRLQVLIYNADTLDEQIADMLAAQAAIPGIEFVLRFYASNILTFDAAEWARSRHLLLNRIMAAGVVVVGILPANEPNIELPEHLRADWAYQVEWYQLYAQTWHFLPGPYVDLHLPALSPCVPGWTDGLDAYRDGGLGDLYHVQNSHCYPGTERAYEEIMARFPFGRIDITEWNGLDPESYLSSLPDQIESADWFILRWIDPEPGARNVDLIGGEFYESFARAGNDEGGTALTKEELWQILTVPYESYPALTKQIVGMGGIPVGTEVVIGEYTYQLGIVPMSGSPDDIVAYARTGDWGNVLVARSLDGLPPLP